MSVSYKFSNNKMEVFRQGRQVGTIDCFRNEFHSQHIYLNLHISELDKADSVYILRELYNLLGSPLQVLLSSAEISNIEKLELAGFILRRVCYVLELTPADYLASPVNLKLLATSKANSDYSYFSDLMWQRYKETHRNISPLTATKEQFREILPALVVYAENAQHNFALLEDHEIAYVHGQDRESFRKFCLALVSSLFAQYETISLEADQHDEYAMILKDLFNKNMDVTWNTYIRD